MPYSLFARAFDNSYLHMRVIPHPNNRDWRIIPQSFLAFSSQFARFPPADPGRNTPGYIAARSDGNRGGGYFGSPGGSGTSLGLMASPWFDKLTTNGVGFRPDGMTSGVGAGVGVVGVGWISAAERQSASTEPASRQSASTEPAPGEAHPPNPLPAKRIHRTRFRGKKPAPVRGRVIQSKPCRLGFSGLIAANARAGWRI